MQKLKPDQPDDAIVLPVKKRGEIMSRTLRGCWIPACAGMTEGVFGQVDEVWEGFESRNRSKIFSVSVCQTSAIIRDSKILTVRAISSGNRQVQVVESLGLTNG